MLARRCCAVLLALTTTVTPIVLWAQDSEAVASATSPTAQLLQLVAPTELSQDDRLLTQAIRDTIAIELGNLGYEVIEPQPGEGYRAPDLIVEYLVYSLAPRVHVSVAVWLGDRSARVAATTDRLRVNVTLYNQMTTLAEETLQTAARELANDARVARVPLSLSADAPAGTVATILPDRQLVLGPGDSQLVARGARIVVEFERDGYYSQTGEYIVGAEGLELIAPQLATAPRLSAGLRYTVNTPLGFGIASRVHLRPERLWIALEGDGYFTGGRRFGPSEQANTMRHLEPRALAGMRLFGRDDQRWRVTLTSGVGAFFTWIDNDIGSDNEAFIDPYLMLFGAGFEYRFGDLTVDVRNAVVYMLGSQRQLLPDGIGISELNPRLSVGASWNW